MGAKKYVLEIDVVFIEPADWIGVVLIVLGLLLVGAAIVVHNRKGEPRSTHLTAIHPSLARELSEDEDGPISSNSGETDLEAAPVVPGEPPVIRIVPNEDPGSKPLA